MHATMHPLGGGASGEENGERLAQLIERANGMEEESR
jgi:hypothetical protein